MSTPVVAPDKKIQPEHLAGVRQHMAKYATSQGILEPIVVNGKWFHGNRTIYSLSHIQWHVGPELLWFYTDPADASFDSAML